MAVARARPRSIIHARRATPRRHARDRRRAARRTLRFFSPRRINSGMRAPLSLWTMARRAHQRTSCLVELVSAEARASRENPASLRYSLVLLPLPPLYVFINFSPSAADSPVSRLRRPRRPGRRKTSPKDIDVGNDSSSSGGTMKT